MITFDEHLSEFRDFFRKMETHGVHVHIVFAVWILAKNPETICQICRKKVGRYAQTPYPHMGRPGQ